MRGKSPSLAPYPPAFAECKRGKIQPLCHTTDPAAFLGAVAGLVGIECGVVSGVINLESSGVEASDWRPRHDEYYHDA
jgi:hypothetical protein